MENGRSNSPFLLHFIQPQSQPQINWESSRSLFLTNLFFYLVAPEPPILSFSTRLDGVAYRDSVAYRGTPGKANVEAVPGVVLVPLVPPDQHVGKAGLAHPRSAHDQNAGAGKPDNITS